MLQLKLLKMIKIIKLYVIVLTQFNVYRKNHKYCNGILALYLLNKILDKTLFCRLMCFACKIFTSGLI